MPAMAEIIEINDIAQLDQYQLAWTQLLLETPRASFFQTLDWLRIYWKHFGDRQRLRVLIALVGGTPIGIVPLCVRPESYRIGKLRVLTYPLHDWGTYFGPIGPQGAATLLLAMRHLRSSVRDWDLLDLRWTNKRDTDRGRTPRALSAVGWRADEGEWATTAVIDLSGSWDDYLAGRSQKWRANRRSQQRSLERQGCVEYERYRPQGAVWGEDEPRWNLL
ncbi:MAG: GNAT family N-acetyltransferase, partial [Pirellulales bacterium]